ncbi:conserved hypothetical protein [Talaromyces marneffei ATCC 18224]|uniref:AB hydrolase-1 domain-containing protein n=1 Tax=Talaromyces marneffei (strain ATCC 18224 / CBS 334.59 / QM 7333) TaxID=441960 RepID=B6QE22_TALMQ|nr:conserved hypothetical protein [Talaromyces marneffei ATCC 18224]
MSKSSSSSILYPELQVKVAKSTFTKTQTDTMEFVQTSPETKIHLRLVKESSISDSSPLLVFLHYWGGSSSTWYKLTSPDSPTSLSARYPSISINNRGWGQSTGPTAESGATGKDYSIAPLAQDLVAVLQSLATNEATASIAKDNGIVLVGHSMGAKVALAALEKLSDDILALVKGLVLVAPAPPTRVSSRDMLTTPRNPSSSSCRTFFRIRSC